MMSWPHVVGMLLFSGCILIIMIAMYKMGYEAGRVDQKRIDLEQLERIASGKA